MSIYYIYKIKSDLEINDDFGAFWRYLEQAPEMIIKLDHQSMFTLDIDRQRNAQKARLVPANLKPKSLPIYKIAPNEF